MRDFHRCSRCSRVNFMCKCIPSSSALTASASSASGAASVMPTNPSSMHRDVEEAGPSGMSSQLLLGTDSTADADDATTADSVVGITLRAATSMQPFSIYDFLSTSRSNLYGRLTDEQASLPVLRTKRYSNASEEYSSFMANRTRATLMPHDPAPPSISLHHDHAPSDQYNCPAGVNVSASASSAATALPVATTVIDPALQGSSSGELKNDTNELEALHSRLISLLECPVCLEPISPPIHQCRRGHLVCHRCKPHLSLCPTCRERMTDTRNWAVERIAEELRYPCKNSSAGCPLKMALCDKDNHEAACTFRTFTCPFRACSWSGFLPDMLPHLRHAHSSRFLEGHQQQIDVELNSPTLFYTDWAVSCLGEVFRFNVFQNIPNSMLYASAYYLGAANKAADFVYTVELSGRQNRNISYSRQTHSESTKMSSLCQSCDCFLIKGDVIKYFVKDGKLGLKIQFHRSRLDWVARFFYILLFFLYGFIGNVKFEIKEWYYGNLSLIPCSIL